MKYQSSWGDLLCRLRNALIGVQKGELKLRVQE